MYDKSGKLIDRREMLKIKLKSLADEARIIRRQERAALRNENWMRSEGDASMEYPTLSEELRLHRIGVVRKAARDTHIAYGLIRGMPLQQMEPTAKTDPDWDAVEKMVKKYGPRGMEVVRHEAIKRAA